jgi:hypothetical protein
LEVAGPAALFSNSSSARDMSDRLRTLLTDPSLQRTLSTCGRERALRYHPGTVDATISAFWQGILRDE